MPEPLGRLEDLSRRAEPRKKEHSMQPHDEEEKNNGVSGKFENCGMERNSTMELAAEKEPANPKKKGAFWSCTEFDVRFHTGAPRTTYTDVQLMTVPKFQKQFLTEWGRVLSFEDSSVSNRWGFTVVMSALSQMCKHSLMSERHRSGSIDWNE